MLIRPPEAEDENYTAKDAAGKQIKINKDFRGWVLQRPSGGFNGLIIAAIPEGEKMVEQIQEVLNAEARWLLVKSLDENIDPELNVVKLSMIPIDVVQDEITGDGLSATDRKEGFIERSGIIELKACVRNPETGKCKPNTGDFVRLEIHNTGTEDVYVTILNLRSDGKIGPAFPTSNRDNLIKAGTIYKVPNAFHISEPFGEESFRAIITRNPTDFTPLINPELLTRGTESERSKNAADSPLGKILISAQIGKRSAEAVSAPASWATTTKTFFIVAPIK